MAIADELCRLTVTISHPVTMKITFLVVGKTVSKPLDTLINDYAARLTHYAPFEMVVIPDLKNTKALTEAQQKEKEGEMIATALKDGDWVVLLDEGGKEFRSVEFARYIAQKQQTVQRRLVFIVGGPYGFAQRIYDAARENISLSRMTFSHQMVRLIFVEQLYRAMTILKGEPYHHE